VVAGGTEASPACRPGLKHSSIAELAGVPRYILWNARVVTMDEGRPVADALLVEGNAIAAIGSNHAILALADEATPVVDLGGRAVLPGFLDPHAHLFDAAAEHGLTFDQVQQLALESGTTAVSDMFARPAITQELLSYASDGKLRLRLHLYLPYNNTCGTVVWGQWYERFPPKASMGPRMTMGGVKVFVEPSVCGGEHVKPVFSEALLASFTPDGLAAWGDNRLLLSRDELQGVARRAHDLGYQVAIHAIGDVGVETSLDAIEGLLGDSGDSTNERRHMILHGWFLRDDLLPRYARSGILAVVEPATTCRAEFFLGYVGWQNGTLFSRWHDLFRAGARVSIDGDWPYDSIDPMVKLSALVTGRHGTCPPSWDLQTASVREGMRGMTTEAAYAMGREEEIGSLGVGKLADLVVLSANPFDVEPDEIERIRALVTIVDGKVEFARDSDGDGVPDVDDRCPASDLRDIVVVGTCDTGVRNLVLDGGCSIADRIESCRAAARHHGSFVSCVAQLAKGLAKAGMITGRDHGAIQRCSARPPSR
jgi:predicted amidohydrolase YtcJ